MNSQTTSEPSVRRAAMALSVGGTLRTEADAPSTLTGALERAATAFPKNGVTHIRQDGTESRLTYPALLALARRVAGGLRSQGLSQGDRLLLQLPSGEEFIPAFWGCMLAGVLPVPLALPPVFDQPHALISKLQNAWRLLGRPKTLTTRSLQRDVRGLPTSEPGRNFDVIAIEDLLRAEAAGSTDQAEPEDPALLLLTSGSTGIPKAVVLSHRNLLGYSRGAAQMNQFTPDDVSLNWMPLDHVGGIVMFHVRDVVVGCNHIDAPTDVVLQSPLVWLEWVSRLRVTITWAPNFAFGLVNDRADELPGRDLDLRCLRFILNGGEAIVTKTARRFLELLAPCGLPPTSMKPAWGMSETSSGVTYSDRFDLEQTTDLDNFVEVGAPIPGISIRIVDGLCRLLEEGQLGSLQVKGLSVTGGYLDNAALNTESFTEDGWFRTGDLGVIRDGRLTITGREKDVIIINGVNFHSHEIEAVAEEVDGVDVSFTAACAVRTMGEPSDQLAVFYASPLTDAGELAGLARRLRAALVRLASVNPEHLILLPREEIPKTSIGKIQRRLLKERFEAGEFDERSRRFSDGPESAPDDALFQRVWRRLSRAADGALPAGPWLILCDTSGIGDGLADRIRRTGAECYTAHAGAGFRALSSNAFTVDPGIPDNFVSLYGFLRKEGCSPVSTVHCWGLAEEGSEREAAAFMRERTLKLESVLWAAQAITRGGEVAGGCCLWVVTRRAFEVHAGEQVSPAASAVAGLLRTLTQESGSLSCSQIDLGGDGGDASVDMIFSEFTAPSRLAEVALRGSVRWQPFLAEADRVGSHASPPPLVMKGVYLLSGGAGGIGGHVARFLISQYDARVLIVGRSPEALVAAKLRELGGRTGQVRYDSVDIGDLPGVLASVSEAENAWGRTLDGIFHLAGSHETRLLDDETPESFGRGLHGKVAGGWALDQLARSRPGVLVVNFSSLLGYFGGYEQGAYSASNAYLEGLALQQRAAGLRSSTLLWSSWLNTGMNSDPSLEEAKRAKGYRSLSPGKGLELLDAALRLGPGVFLAGLDGGNVNIRPHLFAAPGPATSETPFTEPVTETQRALARIWQEVLKRPRVGINDNFFEIGGRSLLAARIFSMIEGRFGKKLALATLFRSPTVELLAKIVDGEPAEPARCRLVVLQAEGGLTPLFCMPGAGSDAIAFHSLSKRLGTDRPMYGLQAAGLDTTEEPDSDLSVESVCAQFVDAIRTAQPRGPYLLAGHCFGGLLAYEVAQQLSAAGEKVALLALIDTIVSDTFPTSFRVSLSDKLAHHRQQMAGRALAEKCSYVIRKLAEFKEAGESRKRLNQSFGRVEDMHRRYTLSPYRGRLTLFMAADSFLNRFPERDPRQTWMRMGSESPHVMVVAGDHASLLKEPNVGDLAHQLRGCLSGSPARTLSACTP